MTNFNDENSPRARSQKHARWHEVAVSLRETLCLAAGGFGTHGWRRAPRSKASILCTRAFAVIFALSMLGCDQFELPNRAKHEEQASEAVQSGDFPRAVRSFEAVLDGTERTAPVHYQLALIYDDKLDDPVSALHHYRRFLRMSQDAPRKREVQDIIERIELVLATRAADGGIVTKREAARLRNENLALAEKNVELTDKNKSLESDLAAARKQIASLPKSKATPTPKPSARNPATAEAEKRVGKETRTYTVQSGDTLASISRKFYETPGRWKDIADANHNTLQGSINLQVGQVLIIP